MKLQVVISVKDVNIITSKSSIIYDMSKKLDDYFRHKKYGADVLELQVGLIMVFTKPGYDSWYREKKPKYIEYKRSVSKLIGEVTELSKVLKYEVRLSDEVLELFINSNDETSRKIILSELIKSLSKLKVIVKKLDFELEKFEIAINNFASNEKLK